MDALMGTHRQSLVHRFRGQPLSHTDSLHAQSRVYRGDTGRRADDRSAYDAHDTHRQQRTPASGNFSQLLEVPGHVNTLVQVQLPTALGAKPDLLSPKLRQDMILFLTSKGHSEDHAGYLCDEWKIGD